jgi:hypothetical protein
MLDGPKIVTDGFELATVSVPHVLVVRHEIDPASAMTVTWPTPVPVALPEDMIVAMPLAGATGQVTVGEPLPPPPPPDEPYDNEN